VVLDHCDTADVTSDSDRFEAVLSDVERGLRAEGWAEHVSVSRELKTWARVAETVGEYSMTVDDYTNDLCSRDYLELTLKRVPNEARVWLTGLIAPMDEKFRGRTVEDERGLLGRFFRIDQDSAWWWHRTPAAGPLADYLAGLAEQ
jgi:hypothetical protein